MKARDQEAPSVAASASAEAARVVHSLVRKIKEDDDEQQVAAARVVHSQVRKIKAEEDEKVKVHETYQHKAVPEPMRVVLRDLARQRSRSPLGRACRPAAISIGGGS